MIDKNNVHRIFNYDPITGNLKWLVSLNNRALSGSIANSTTNSGYLRVGVHGESYLVHRIIWLMVNNRWPKYEIDHINGNRSDNRLINLREVTCRENSCNRREHRDGKIVGTRRQQSGRYVARITINGHRFCLGTFNTEQEAHAVYLNAIKEKAHA